MDTISSIATGLAVVAIAVMPTHVYSEDGQQLEREAMYQKYLDFSSYVKGGRVEPHWMADGNSFWYAEGSADDALIWRIDPVARREIPMFDVTRLRASIATALGRELANDGLPFNAFEFVDEEETIVRFAVADRHFELQLETYDLYEAKPSLNDNSQRTRARTWHDLFNYVQREILSPDEEWFAGIDDHNIYLRSTSTEVRREITSDGEQDCQWVLGRTEIGNSGLWSPNSAYLAAVKMDYRGVPAVPIVHYLEDPEVVQELNYSKSGQKWPKADLYIFQPSSFQPSSDNSFKVSIDHDTSYLMLLGWKHDSTEVYLQTQNRYASPSGTFDVHLLAANPHDGSVRVILDATSRGRMTLLEHSNRFLWSSIDGSGIKVSLYDLDGQLLIPAINGSHPVTQLAAVDEAGGWLYFLGHESSDDPINEHLYRVKLNGGDVEKLTESTGIRGVEFSPSRSFFVETHSFINRPPTVELRSCDGRLVLPEPLAESDISGLQELNWSPGEVFAARNAKGDGDIHGVLYKPNDFDPSREYPLIQFIYPTGRLLFQRAFVPQWDGCLKAQAFAQMGFVTIFVRRSPNAASFDFESVKRPFAHTVTADSVAVMRQLAAERPYIDLDRVGVYGNSKGGFYSILALLEAPEIYDVGVAVYPMTDAAAHMWNHAFLGEPGSNPQGFETSSVLRLADKLDGKLLLIHGTADAAIPLSHTMRMADALIRANKPFDMLIMPDESHSTRNISDGYGLDYAMRYFVEHLKP